VINKLFVYGSLRSGFQNPAYLYLSQYFTLIGTGRAKAKMYDMGDYPVAVPTTEEKYIVGELYELKNIHETDWALSQLDDYEGVNPETGETAFYKRDTTVVNCSNVVYDAWVYWFTGNTEGKPEVSSGDMLEYMKNKK
jgi:gamma-glutamylcyclotransferase (GGCT)/AIG2-like uncharacterized protein YtfP